MDRHDNEFSKCMVVRKQNWKLGVLTDWGIVNSALTIDEILIVQE
jgi:hypothetical protein